MMKYFNTMQFSAEGGGVHEKNNFFWGGGGEGGVNHLKRGLG